MIDEIHYVGDDSRGAIFESMITRVIFLSQTAELKNSPISFLRIVALSATISNIKDVADWLKVKPDGLFIFGEEYRPVLLNKRVLGFNLRGNYFLFDQSLNYKLKDIIDKYSLSKPVLIFVSTQKSTVKTC